MDVGFIRDGFHLLYDDVDLRIFEKCFDSDDNKNILVLREVNSVFKKNIGYLVSQILRLTFSAGLPEGSLKKFGDAKETLYERRDASKDFLNRFLYNHERKSTFSVYWDDKDRNEVSVYRSVHSNDKLQREAFSCCKEGKVRGVRYTIPLENPGQTYDYPSFRWDSNTLKVLDQCRLYWESRGVDANPRVLEYDALKDPELETYSKEYFQKLEPLLTCDLRELFLRFKPTIFSQIAEDQEKLEAKKAEELDEKPSKLEPLLFGKQLLRLTSFHLDLDGDDSLDAWIAICLRRKDVETLEMLLPNLRHLTFKCCYISNDFIEALLASAFIKNLESLRFSSCIFENESEWLSKLLTYDKFNNLRCLQLPYIVDNKDFFYAMEC